MWATATLRTLDEAELATALTTRARRRVRRGGKTRRKRPARERDTAVPFDPPGALLDRIAGRLPRHRAPEED